MKLKTLICLLVVVVTSQAGTLYAARVEYGCDAERYVPCSSFRTSRTIKEQAPVVTFSDFTRSKGKWTVTIGYEPAGKCAKVTFYVDMGPLDFDREYKRVFIDGGGAISDSGSFIHKADDMESALRIHNSSCRVPAPEPLKKDGDSKERQALDEERERQELEEERERLAMAEERERLALQAERERLEEEQRLVEERERQRLAQQRRERERRRLAELRRERERQRLAELRRERERQRLAQQRREQERLRAQRRSEANTAAAMAILGGFLQGFAGGSGNPFGAGIGRSPSYGGSGGGSCEQAKQRAERIVESVNPNAVVGYCNTYRRYLQVLQSVQRELANGGCPSHEVRQYDQAIAQTRQGARASCAR